MNGSRGTRIAACVCLSLVAALVLTPGTSTAQTPEKVEAPTAVEAWYYAADEGAAPAPLPAIPDPVNPYGENTLHVSITAGKEDTRTYLALDLADLPPTFELAEGTLTLPIDPAGATMNAATSRVQVCLSEIPAKSDEGSFDEPPEVDCKTRAPASYMEKPFPRLVADITDFGQDLTFSGLAIMPSRRAVEQSDTWHVTFYGKKNEAEEARPITAELSILPADDLVPVIDGEVPTTTETDSATTTDLGSGSAGGFDFDSSTGPTLDSGSAPVQDVAQDPVDASTPAEEGPLLELATETQPSYPIVWALPLLLLALSIYFSSALTREVVLRRNPPSS